eukprot:GHRR01004055.1.p1 GENE.GHRR01004055.1~~GHRR01004055.1.p1  ORF type:complete len:980 (+),score=386.14 GHRR01004055.1:396-3335(+)
MADHALGPERPDDVGDTEGLAYLPPFANAENRGLNAQIRGLEKQLQQLDLSVEENAGRVGVMGEHLKNVQQEITYTESRVEAERKEIDTEHHLKVMAGKETARIKSDLERLEREKLELSDRITSLQTSIFKGSEKLDQFKLLMNWNQEELDQWAIAQRQKEEDNQALEKYRRQDEGKMKEVGLQVEKLTQQVAAQKDALESEITDTQAAQIQLDRAAQDFRQLHQERQELIRQWDEAREAMKHRDQAIQVMAAAYAERKVLLKQKQADLDAQAYFLAGEQANNHELEAQITYYERELGKAREQQASEATKLDELANQVDLLQNTLAKAANDLAAAGNTNTAAQKDLDEKRQRLEAVRKRHTALKQQLEAEFGQLGSLEAKVSQLEAIRKREEQRLKGLQKDQDQLKKEQFKANQTLHLLRTREKELISELAGGQSQSKNLAARLKVLDEQLMRQSELMYTVDYNMQEIERRIARAGGHRSDDEARALNARIQQLTEVLEDVNAEHSMLLEQVKQAELHLHEARRANTALAADKRRVDETIERLQLETDSAARTLKIAVAEKERQLVDHDVMKLQVRRLRDVLSLHADEVYSLESRKAQLKLSLDERRHEIEVHRDGLKAELKLVREDIHRITLELRDRQQKVEVLGTKFDTLASKNRATDPEGGEPKSQAYYIIKATQEREDLQVQGDALDAKITQSEAEVAALESTLAQMQATNTAFSTSLRHSDSKEVREQQRQLRQQLDASYDRLKALRQQEAAVLTELQQQQAASSSSEAELAGLQAVVDGMAKKRAEAERQVEEQQEKYGRALRAVQRAQKLLAIQASMANGSSTDRSIKADSAAADCVIGGSSRRGASAGPGPGSVAAEVEQDVQIAEVRLVTKAMLSDLHTLAMQYPDAGIADAVQAAGLKLPCGRTPGSQAGSATGSRAGSVGGSIRGQSSYGNLDAASSMNGGTVPKGGANRTTSNAGRIGAVKSMAFSS